MRLFRRPSPRLRSAREFVRYACSLMPGATDRLLADLKRDAHTDLTQTAAADRTRDGHPDTDNPSPRKDTES